MGLTQLELSQIFEEINIFLAQHVGWRHIELNNSSVYVSQGDQDFQQFDFMDKSVIYPIAQKYNKKATRLNTQWVCEYTTKDHRKMNVISQSEQIALALAIVLELI